MKAAHRHFGKRLLCIGLSYLLFCGFVWGILTVQTRSYNRISHEPAAMMQLLLLPDGQTQLKLADQTLQWKLPQPESQWIWAAALPDAAGNAAVLLWQMLSAAFA